MAKNIHQLKSAKIYFCLAVLFLVAKPFLGFSFTSQLQQSKHLSICVKAFTKRKQEFVEDSEFNIIAIQKKLAEPVKEFFLSFSLLLSVLFPVVFGTGNRISTRYLRKLQLSLSPREHTYLLNNSFII